MGKIKTLAIIQARVSSSRLPGKVIKEISGKTLIEIMSERVKHSEMIEQLILATSLDSSDNDLINVCHKIRLPYFRGSLDDVLERFYKAAEPYMPEFVVRLTGDCPLMDPIVIDSAVKVISDSDYDYVSNTLNPTFPDGIDVEVFKFSALRKAYLKACLPSEREHVTPYIWKNSTFKGGNIFKSFSLENPVDCSNYRLTVDYHNDLNVIEYLIKSIGIDKGWHDYVNIINRHPEISFLNKEHSRNEGYIKTVSIDDINTVRK